MELITSQLLKAHPDIDKLNPGAFVTAAQTFVTITGGCDEAGGRGRLSSSSRGRRLEKKKKKKLN